MKTFKKSSGSSAIKLKFLLFIAFILIVMVSCSEKAKKAGEATETGTLSSVPPPPKYTIEKGDTTWYEVDQMPEFKGGDSALLQFLVENTKYPANAKAKGIQGRVVVVFTVSESGAVSNVKIDQSVDPEIDAEALRVVSSIPQFEKPAFKNGKEVPVWYAVPISFKLK